MPYKYMDTITGDAEFIVKAKSLGELLVEAGKALVGLMYDPEKLEKARGLDIEAEGEDPENLVYNWLSEILFLQDTENFFFRDFSVSIENKGDKLIARGKGFGQPGDPSLVEAYVKAVTLHNFYVKKTPEGWEARIAVDL